MPDLDPLRSAEAALDEAERALRDVAFPLCPRMRGKGEN